MNMLSRQIETGTQVPTLVLSENQKFREAVTRILQNSPEIGVSSEAVSLADIGEAGGLFLAHRVVIFDAYPESDADLETIAQVLTARSSDNIVFAFTDNDLSLQRARELLDAGVDHVLPFATQGDRFRELLARELGDKKEREVSTPPVAGGKILAVTKSRGGAGATTVAVNLALGLLKAPGEPRVALIDLDMQFGNAGVFLDLEDNGGMQRLTESSEPPDERFLKGIMQTHSSGLDVLCAPTSIMPLQALSVGTIEDLIALLSSTYDYIVFDLPQALVDWVEPVLANASNLEVVMDTSVPCVRQVRRLLDFLEYEHFRPQVDLIVNREKKPLIRSENVKQAEAILGRDIGHWLPDAPDVARRAIDIGRPAIETKPGSGLGRSYARIVNAVRANEKTEKGSKSRERV